MTGLLTILETLGRYAAFCLAAAAASLRALLLPRLSLYQLYAILVGAVPLGLVAGLSLGAVVWMHTHDVLSRTGATTFLPTVHAAAVVLELAPLGAGLIVAARTGAGLAAELGAMKINEQIDAFEMLGASPVGRLVGPRVLACVVTLPALTVLIAALAIVTGFTIDSVVEDTTWGQWVKGFLTGPFSELRLDNVVPAVLKTTAFGAGIGVAGCFCGLRAGGGTEGVGRAATQGVVLASLSVLALDVVLVLLIKAV